MNKDFKEAIAIAEEELARFQEDATNINLEAAIIEGNCYEISFSYYLPNRDNLNVIDKKEETKSLELRDLIHLMSERKTYKTFLIDKATGEFKGFKAYKEA